MARTRLRPNQLLDEIATEHRQWLAGFDRRYAKIWERLCSADYEAAMTEAAIRRILSVQHRVTVEPNEALTGNCGGPDFQCAVGGKRFCVEVTCFPIADVERSTGIVAGPRSASGFDPNGMIDKVFAKAASKSAQASRATVPTLLAIGTFHATASMIFFGKRFAPMYQTGKTQLTWSIEATSRRVTKACVQSELHRAVFLKPDSVTGVAPARQSLAGILLCGVGVEPAPVRGLLHPNAARPFNEQFLPGVEFHRIAFDQSSGRVRHLG